MEDTGDMGDFGCDPVVERRGESCMGREPRQPAQCANPPLGVHNVGHWVLPGCPPLFSLSDVAFVTLRWVFRRLLWQWMWNMGAGGVGGLAVHWWHMDMETQAGKTLFPHPRTNWCQGLDAK